ARGAVPRWLLLIALASLTPTGGLLVLAVTTLAMLAPRAAASWPRRVGVVLLGLALQATWVVPSVVHPGSGAVADDGIFALRAEGPWGPLVTALGTGGVWNQDATPLSRGTGLALLLTAAVLVLAGAGIGPLARSVGRATVGALVAGSAAGLLLAVASGWGPTSPAVSWLVATLPGGGLLRDSQKWLAPLVVLLAAAAPWGAVRLGRRLREPAPRVTLLVALLVLPVACLPDLTWGALGRLTSVPYPADWDQARAVLADSSLPGEVVSLPWAPLRRFGWNHDRPVLDPAPRYLPRTTLTAADLTVRHRGVLVTVVGDDPRAAQVSAALAAGKDLGPVLARLGVGWALVAADAAPPGQLPAGARAVLTGDDLRLYRLAATPVPQPRADGTTAVVVVDVLVLVLLAGAAAAAVRSRSGHRRKAEPA
ncbi:MAG TPA: hypothetical protein VFN19_10565, partial [Candidatus Nanopelagicales bacterium]|nr:hypothetical protein [Candidatus Nanopelagicales bacterium]